MDNFFKGQTPHALSILCKVGRRRKPIARNGNIILQHRAMASGQSPVMPRVIIQCRAMASRQPPATLHVVLQCRVMASSQSPPLLHDILQRWAKEETKRLQCCKPFVTQRIRTVLPSWLTRGSDKLFCCDEHTGSRYYYNAHRHRIITEVVHAVKHQYNNNNYGHWSVCVLLLRTQP